MDGCQFFSRNLTTKRSFTWLPKRRNMCLECACWPIVCCQIHCGSAWSVVNPTEASGGSSTRPASLVWQARSGHEEDPKSRRKKGPDRSFAIFCNDSEGLPAKLKEISKSLKLKVLVVAVDNPTGPEAYKIAKDADVTVVLFHSGGANALFADGSVRFLQAGMSIQVLAALITRAGGEIVSAADY
jgi:prepilin-type processing-associated H-X9-DG protein